MCTAHTYVTKVSRYAGAALPDQAKRVVKQSILSLPSNWARIVQQRDSEASGQQEHAGVVQEAAERVLTFAVEGLEVLYGVTKVFSESVEMADACVLHELSLDLRCADNACCTYRWLERLRVVGINHQRDRRAKEAAGELQFSPMQTLQQPASPSHDLLGQEMHRRLARSSSTASMNVDP